MKSSPIFIETRARWLNLPILIAAGFLFGFMNYGACIKQLQDFQSRLDDPQKVLYQEIVQERTKICNISLFQGFLLSGIYILFSIFLLNRRCGYTLFSEGIAIILVVTYFFYILAKKNKNMLIDGNLSAQDSKDWYMVYQCMERQFHSYFIFGFLVAGLLLQLMDIYHPPNRICIQFTSTTEKKNNIKKKKPTKR